MIIRQICLFITISIFVAFSCSKLSSTQSKKTNSLPTSLIIKYDKNPEWLDKYINKLNTEPVKDSPESITKFEYKGKNVYFFSSPCCGKEGKLYDQNKNIICSVGKNKISYKKLKNCNDFDKTKKNKKLIWQENRD
ncbi:MAG: hypothetical protein H7263_00005 [Candidatus Sericytochromatia bacterium]|nr:hypothetical protein [Candidatus Sericytochromatia bacterium]